MSVPLFSPIRPKSQELLAQAAQLQPELLDIRRTLHQHPELGFALTETKALVRARLEEMGYQPTDCGRAGLIALAGGKPGGGSEDFAFVSHRVPTLSLFLAAGNSQDGYLYGQHNPQARFDDSVLSEGSAVYAHMALRWLKDNA